MTLAAEHRRLLAARNVTGYELARRVGTRPSTASRWLGGSRQPFAHHLAAIATALDLSDTEIARLVKAATEDEG